MFNGLNDNGYQPLPDTVEKCGLWAFFEGGKLHIGMNKLDHRKNTEEDGYLVRGLWVQL